MEKVYFGGGGVSAEFKRQTKAVCTAALASRLRLNRPCTLAAVAYLEISRSSCSNINWLLKTTYDIKCGISARKMNL